MLNKILFSIILLFTVISFKIYSDEATFSNLSLSGSVLSEYNYSYIDNQSFLFKYSDIEEKQKHLSNLTNYFKTNIELSNSYKINFKFNFEFSDNIALSYKDGSKVETPSFLINELYADVNFYDIFYVRLGKQRLKWGSGWIFNPTDIINPPKDPLKQNKMNEGVPSLKLEVITKYISLMTFGVVYDLFQYTGVGGKISTSAIPYTNLATSFYYSQRDHILSSINISTSPFYVFPYADSLNFWFEGCFYTKSRYPQINHINSSIEYIKPEKNEDIPNFKFSFLVGASFTIPIIETILLCEYYFIQEGYQEKELDTIFSFLRNENSDVRNSSSKWIEEVTGRTGRLGRQYIYISLNQPSFTKEVNKVSDNIGVSSSILLNIEDRSLYVQNSVFTTIIPNSKISLLFWFTYGTPNSEFFNSVSRLGFSLSVEVSF
jgi:hypothetical protein